MVSAAGQSVARTFAQQEQASHIASEQWDANLSAALVLGPTNPFRARHEHMNTSHCLRRRDKPCRPHCYPPIAGKALTSCESGLSVAQLLVARPVARAGVPPAGPDHVQRCLHSVPTRHVHKSTNHAL